MQEQANKNTDKVIWRQPTRRDSEGGSDQGMEPHVFVTKGGGVGFNHYGSVVVKPIEEWVELARAKAPWNDPSVVWVCEEHPSKEQEHRLWPLFWRRCGGAGMPA